MSAKRYTYQCRFSDGGGHWEIVDMGTKGYWSFNDPVVWSMPYRKSHDGKGQPPLKFRREYERLLRESGYQFKSEPTFNLVEAIQDEDSDCAFDQPCAYGHRVEFHAVYCHNESWFYAPSKCRRHNGMSIWGDKPWPHEECPGFKANPRFVEKEPVQ